MRRIFCFFTIVFFVAANTYAEDSYTTNINLTKPGRGSQGWWNKLNDNFDSIDTHVGGINNTIDDLPDMEVHAGTFNSTTGDSISLSKTVDATNEYSVKVTPTSRAGAIGDIWVTKTTSSFTVYCSESNTTDTFEATVYFKGDVASYGGSVYRRYYVSPSTSISDHSVVGTAGSLAYVLNAIGGNRAVVEMPGNRTYTITASDVTIPSTVHLVFQPGAVISVGSSRTLKIDGDMTAGKHRIFAGTGDTKIAPGAADYILPHWWHDGTSDWGPAFQSACDSGLDAGDQENLTVSEPNPIFVPEGNYPITTEIVSTEHVRVYGAGSRNAVLEYDNARSGWMWTVATTNANFQGGATFRDLGMQVEDHAGTPSGILRFSDVIHPIIENMAFLASNTAEAIRFENSERYCESVYIRDVTIDYGVYGVRFVPSDESVSDRYTSVTDGTPSFAQTYIENLYTRGSGTSPVGLRLNGTYPRSLFVNVGGWHRSTTGVVIQCARDIDSAVFINPWSDSATMTPEALFDIEAIQTEIIVYNPLTGGVSFDRNRPNYWAAPNILGRIIYGDNASATETSEHIMVPDYYDGHVAVATSSHFRIDDDFESLSDAWTTQNTVDVDSAIASSLEFTPNTNTAAISSDGPIYQNANKSTCYQTFEVRFMVDNFADQHFYIGLGIRDSSNFVTSLGSTGSQYGIWFTNEYESGAASSTLYCVTVDSAEVDRVSMGSISANSWIQAKMIIYRDNDTGTRDVMLFMNGAYVGQISNFDNSNLFVKATARNISSTSNMYVDRLLMTGNRYGVY